MESAKQKISMKNQTPKLNPDWIRETRDYFKKFLKITKFPHPERNGNRGSKFDYPEWLIMFIAVLSVKVKLKTHQEIHQLTKQYWSIISEGLPKQIRKKPISATQLRDRLKKICHSPRRPAGFIFQIFPREILN